MLGTVASSRRVPGSTVQSNCIVVSLLSVGAGVGAIAGSGSRVGTGVGSDVDSGTGAGNGAGSGDGDGTASGIGGEAGAGEDGTGVQPAAKITSDTNRIMISFISKPTVHQLSIDSISHNIMAAQGAIDSIRGEGKRFPEPFIVSFNWTICHISSFC